MATHHRRLPRTIGQGSRQQPGSTPETDDRLAAPMGPSVGPPIGTSAVTTVSPSAQEGVKAQGRVAAVPDTAVEEPMRDDLAVTSTKARFRVPEWFEILWSNRKARIGLIMLAFFVLVAIFAN